MDMEAGKLNSLSLPRESYQVIVNREDKVARSWGLMERTLGECLMPPTYHSLITDFVCIK